MTLGNMRANGVHSLAVYCERYHHWALFDVNDFADDVPVPLYRASLDSAALEAALPSNTVF